MEAVANDYGLVDFCLPPPLAPMGRWMEENIVLPTGPHRGEPFRCKTQPFSRLYFAEVDSGRWQRIAATGPTQTGKSLDCYVGPVLYHCLGLGETVVAGVPDMNMANDKWTEDFLPVVDASPVLRELLPIAGEGSRGGRVKSRVRFRNGATLRFMSGGGTDKNRAGFSSRVLAVTEVDGLDKADSTSREADKLEQMEGRLRSHLRSGFREYLECTVTIGTGRIWREWLNGTQSRILKRCPYCNQYVFPEREHLIGWEEAEDEEEARENAAWMCPECSALWSEEDRYHACLASVLVHKGQEVTPEGAVVGPVPRTRTLGFRWTAVDNFFATAADVAADEWRARKDPDRDNAEKKLCQFVHCLPWDPPDVDLTPLDPEAVKRRTVGLKKGIVPDQCLGIAVAIDTGKRRLHWQAMAITAQGRRHVIEYDSHPVASDKLGTQRALVQALGQLAEYFDRGWQDQAGSAHVPDQVWIDSGYFEHTDAVYEFCRVANGKLGCKPGAERYRPSKGYAEGQRGSSRYLAPKKMDAEVRWLGNQYHLARLKRAQALLCHVNADHWKGVYRDGLAMSADEPGAIVLYEAASPSEHDEFSLHVTAEKPVEEFVEGRGLVRRWVRERRENHQGDAGYNAAAACDFVVAVRAKQQEQAKQGGWFASQGGDKARMKG